METWIIKTLLPKILATAYPKTARIVTHEIGGKKGGNAGDGGFASNTFQMKLTVDTEGQQVSDHLIAKIFPEDEVMRTLHNTELQIINETLWYSQIVPAYISLASKFDVKLDCLWPKFFASELTERAAIVLEDLSKEDFVLATPPANLSFDHARLAMEKVAVMHALSYSLAAHEPQTYQTIIGSMKDNRFDGAGDGFDVSFLKATAQRGLGPLRSRPECADIVAALDKQFEDALGMQRRLLTAYDKKTDVICHGDFLRNNILYKHKDGKAVDACLIDFATIRVASPCSDLVLFIYMSIDPAVLEGDGLEKILRIYYDTLKNTLGAMGKVADPWGGKFEDLVNDFARCTPLAYSIITFFLPLMMAPKEDFHMEAMIELSPEEQEQQNMNLGGPEATERLVNVILDFQKRRFHDHW
ncbi:Hypothetical predicted protein [Cloeon dipterum]|uniref:CHK kinase-like domain-containing protein n=1 Tax=Cloeon dipterum TaxID=197152 RepID=A0A8S1CAU6_9INSE|nr:Hypothetical predicted protein [Cloeon dipterum]